MTPKAREATGRFYGPMVTEGRKILARLTDEELELLHGLLVALRELTDRHRTRVRE